jgi:hypothetical protein
MDHLPIPEHCRARQVIVPHLDLVKYDRHGFVDFLERLRYGKDELLKMLCDEAMRPPCGEYFAGMAVFWCLAFVL